MTGRMIEIEVEVKRSTTLALLVETDKTLTDVWVPKSVIDDYTSTSGELDITVTSIFVPEWMATEKGLV